MDQANSWIKLQFLMTETPLQYNSHHVLPRFPYFVPYFIPYFPYFIIRPHGTTSIGYTKPYAQPNLSNLLSKVYTDQNTFWVKHAAHQKDE